MTDPATTFAELVEHFDGQPGVEVPSGTGFGAGALKVGGSIFAMHAHDHVVLKLPAARVAELIDQGAGQPYSAGKPTPMKQWLALTTDDTPTVTALAEEALAFVSGR